MVFEFSTAPRILFGTETLTQLPAAARHWGSRALIVTGQSSTHYERLASLLAESGITSWRYAVNGEPSIEVISAGLQDIRNELPDFVIGIGGGSALDTGKALAALLTNPGNILDYLEVIGNGRPLNNRPLPYVAIPTTAGTGSEVTSNAVLSSDQHAVKVSMRNPSMLPRLALVDPELTRSMPPALTASTGMDALTQCIEAYVSIKSNPLVDGLCREGIRKAARSLLPAFQNGEDMNAREDMCLAALFSGIALANAKLGAVHGIAGPMGGTTGAAHGLTCAHLLPFVMRTNLNALRERQPRNPVLERFSDLAYLLTGDHSATADDGLAWIEKLCSDLQITNPKVLGLKRDQIPDLVDKCQRSSSMKGNPLVLTKSEVEQVLLKLA